MTCIGYLAEERLPFACYLLLSVNRPSQNPQASPRVLLARIRSMFFSKLSIDKGDKITIVSYSQSTFAP